MTERKLIHDIETDLTIAFIAGELQHEGKIHIGDLALAPIIEAIKAEFNKDVNYNNYKHIFAFARAYLTEHFSKKNLSLLFDTFAGKKEE